MQHRLRRLGGRFKHKVFAIGHHPDTSPVRGANGLDRAHSRVLQPGVPVFSGPDWGGGFASAPSAAIPALFFRGLVRTVGALPLPLPSASWATVRTGRAAKPLAGLDFGMDADDADGADGSAPGSSGVEKVWIVVMLMVRVRARPSRPKPISMPILRRKVAALRSLPASARGPSGQVLDLAPRSPTTSARAPR